jgi:nitrite reductase/ring-hydroxylating ferredoxin subunit
MGRDLTRVAVYERPIHASIERVWENVHDWEHLPWLHASSFDSIELVDRGDWGWRARIGLPPDDRKILLELVLSGQDRYVSRTVEGPGAGSEIWTTLSPVGPDRTDIRVEFLVPDVPAEAADKLGAGFTALYTRLWDEDEAMMQRRTSLLARGRSREAPAPLDLGTLAEVRDRTPFRVEFGGAPFRLVLVAGELLAHAAICPHWLGPLDEGEVEDGCVTCPWHGYRFDVESGARRDAQSPMRLAPAPRVVLDPTSGRVRLEAVS